MSASAPGAAAIGRPAAGTTQGARRVAFAIALVPPALALLAVAPMVLPLWWTGFRLAWQPHPTLGALLEAERPLTVRPFAGAWAVLAAAAWFGLAYRHRRIAWWEVVLFLSGAVLALVRLGNVWLFGLALVPLFARRLALARIPPLQAAAVAAALLAASGWALLATRPPPLPPVAVRAARSSTASGSMLAALAWATPLQQALGDVPVLGAGDPWQAPPEYWPDFQKISLGHVSWLALLDRYGVDVVVLDAAGTQRRAAELMRKQPGWQVLADADGALVARRTTPLGR